jgi:SSS family solute:Na+ symporter
MRFGDLRVHLRMMCENENDSMSDPAELTRAANLARAALLAALHEEQRFIRIHAAEIWLQHFDAADVRGMFQAELDAHAATAGYRVGIWRVLARATGRQEWRERIGEAFATNAPGEWLLALESLCKLGDAPSPALLAHAREQTPTADERPLFCWFEALADRSAAAAGLRAGLVDASAIARLRAAYAIRHLELADPVTNPALAQAADAEAAGGIAEPHVVGAAYVLAADPPHRWRERLERIAGTGTPGARLEAWQALQPCYTAADALRLLPSLELPGDGRIGAAAAILHVHARMA